MNLEFFIGRFHPVFVHLPIGFIVMAVLLDWLGRKKEGYRSAILVCYGLGFLTGFAAVFTGWLLSGEGSYSQSGLWWHKWLAIFTVGLTALLFFVKKTQIDNKFLSGNGILFLLFGLLTLTGHNGGNLTHGSNYLIEYAPGFIKKIAGYNSTENLFLSGKSVDSVLVYPHLIKPILEKKCYSCHGSEKQAGDLDLTAAKNLFVEAATAMPVVGGDFHESELYKRLTLPNTSQKFMPLNGEPVNFTDIQILRKWIELGADTLAVFQPEDLSLELKNSILRDYGLDYSTKSFLEKVKVEPITSEQKKQLTQLGFKVKNLGQKTNLLDVSYEGDFSEEHLNALKLIAEKITFLKISETDLTNELIPFGKFEHLTRLDFYKSNLPERAIEKITQLEQLEVLNLYGTNASSEDLKNLATLKNLKRIYTANTQITENDISDFLELRPDIEVIK